MSSALTAAAIGAAGVVIGAAVAGASGWWTATVAARQVRAARRAERRETAYTEFILSAEALHRVITASETLPDVRPSESIGNHVAQASGSISRTYIAVMVAGTAEAADIGADIYRKAQEIWHWFTGTVAHPPLSPELAAELRGHLDAYTSLLARFADVARRELA
jgi:hypothetical protein